METYPIRTGSTESDTFDLPKKLTSPLELDTFRYRLYTAPGATLVCVAIVWAWFQLNAVVNVAQIIKSRAQGSPLVTFSVGSFTTKSNKL